MLSALIFFILATLLAAAWYPGGTQLDASSTGYSWAQNFLSDLGNTMAWSGAPNWTACLLFNAGLLLVGLCLAHWCLRRSAGLPWWFRVIVLLQALAISGLALCPYDQLPTLHHLMLALLLLSAIGGMLAICLIKRHMLFYATLLVLLIILVSAMRDYLAVDSILVLGVQQKLFVALLWCWYLLLVHLFTFQPDNTGQDLTATE